MQIQYYYKSSTTYSSITRHYRYAYWSVPYKSTWASLIGRQCNTPYYHKWEGESNGSEQSSDAYIFASALKYTTSGVSHLAFRFKDRGTREYTVYGSSSGAILYSSLNSVIDTSQTYTLNAQQ